jgi:hypothetical protein
MPDCNLCRPTQLIGGISEEYPLEGFLNQSTGTDDVPEDGYMMPLF